MLKGDVQGPASNLGNDNSGVIADKANIGVLQSNKNVHHGGILDQIRDCLSAPPVSALEYAFSTLQDIFNQRKEVQANQVQFLVLNETLAQLLKTLNGCYLSQELVESQNEGCLEDLERLLDDLAIFTEKCVSQKLLGQVLTRENRQLEITSYHRRIQSLMTTLQIPTLSMVDIQDTKARDDGALAEDQRLLDQRLGSIAKNRRELTEILNETADQSTTPALMVSLQRCSKKAGSDAEKRFFTRAHQSLAATTQDQVKVESWMITPFEVEFGRKISSGGFGEIFLGKWRKTEVALKVLKVENGATPSAKIVHREAMLCSTFRHAHVLAFYGANVLDENPFIVMPYLKNGNALDYIDCNPECNRLRMLHDASLGLYYLHSKDVVHGEIKAANILIDDAGRAVLADFGLSRVKADATSRTAKQGKSVPAGSRNWMAPELLTGGSLRKPCDIYSFGMTIFEIFSNEMPLSNIPDGDFIDMVTRNHVRPHRQHTDLPDVLWTLAERCWVSLTKGERPDAGSICDAISHSLDMQSMAPVDTTPMSGHVPTALPQKLQEREQVGRPCRTIENNRTIPRNIVVFGQTGVGKSSVINMLAGKSVADVSSGAVGSTPSSQPYDISYGDDVYTFWDTAGLNDADDGIVSSQTALQNLLDLVKNRGINLLVYCIRPRLVDIIRVNHDLFWKIICMEKVPIVFVVTGLEGREDMDDWWRENEQTIRKMKMVFDGHACITSIKGKGGVYQKAYKESAEKVWELVREHSIRQPWYMAPGWSAQAQQRIVTYEKNYKAHSENGIQKFLRELGNGISILTRT